MFLKKICALPAHDMIIFSGADLRPWTTDLSPAGSEKYQLLISQQICDELSEWAADDPALRDALANTSALEIRDLLVTRHRDIPLTNFIDELHALCLEDDTLAKSFLGTTPAQLKGTFLALDQFLKDLAFNGKNKEYNYREMLFELQELMNKLSTEDKHTLVRSTMEHAIARISMQPFVDGTKRLTTMYGSARGHAIEKHSAQLGLDLEQAASDLAYRFAKEVHSSILTGGGPGYMEAANVGAKRYIIGTGDTSIESIGLNIKLQYEQEPNPFQTLELMFSYFFIRKTIFSDFANVCVIFPGGFGTDDEFFEILTLVQTKKKCGKLVLLFDPMLNGIRMDYWQRLLSYIQLKSDLGYINATDMDMLKFVNADEAVAAAQAFFEERETRREEKGKASQG